MNVLSEFLSFVASACRLIYAYRLVGLASIYDFSSEFSSLRRAMRSCASRSYSFNWLFSSSKNASYTQSQDEYFKATITTYPISIELLRRGQIAVHAGVSTLGW